ncbi:MAG: DUF6356 family protein [Alphaproteobacteria bacterium]|jgi:hypothetical protein
MVTRLFTAHPATVGETYTEHFQVASGFGLRMAVGAAACMVHAFLPFLCVKTGSGIISDLYVRAVTHRTSAKADESHEEVEGSRQSPQLT